MKEFFGIIFEKEDWNGDRTRIITARLMTRQERRIYEEG